MSEFETEVWRNTSRGKHAVVKTDRFGKLNHEIVHANKTIQLTKQDRLFNQERAADNSLDPFQNGIFVPVRLVDDADELEFASNPNTRSDDELRDIIIKGKGKGRSKTFDDAVAEISNTYAIERMLNMIEEEDIGTPRQQKVLKSRLVELEPILGSVVESEVVGMVGGEVRPIQPNR